MKRREILDRLGFPVPEAAISRLIIDSDVKNEADDHYAIMHHLLTPSIDVRGIVATHFESKAVTPGETMEMSYQEGVKLLELAEIDDVPIYRGCTLPLADKNATPTSEGVEFIIREARSNDDRPLYIAVLGAATNVAAALNLAPDIASKVIVIWNGGGPYPVAGKEYIHFREFNLSQDVDACRVLLESDAELWQIPANVYGFFEVSLAELAYKVRPCGRIGKYMFDQLVEQNMQDYNPHFLLRAGENWILGDNPTVAVFLPKMRGDWHMTRAPYIMDDFTFPENPTGKMIRIYDSVDLRMTFEDLFAKLNLAYN